MYDRMMRDHGSELHEPGVLVHSDQGSQYMSTTFKQLLSDDGFIQSASRRGNSQDNAPMESFFGKMTCPPDVRAAKDLTVLKHLIEQHKGIQKEAKAWIDKNNADIKSSQEAIEKLEATVRKEGQNPDKL